MQKVLHNSLKTCIFAEIYTKMEGIYVEILVGKRLKRFVEASFQSEILNPKKDSTLINLIKPYLELTSSGDAVELPPDEVIRVELPLSNKRVYSVADKKTYVCNTLWRTQLTKRGHNRARAFFENSFRNSFHTFMDGYAEAQHDNTPDNRMNIKQGVVAFLCQYHIDFTEKDVTALTRSWYRHNDRNECGRVSPAIY